MQFPENEKRPVAADTAERGAECGFQPGNRPSNTNTEAIGEVENCQLTEKPSASTSSVPEICTRSMARRMLGNAVQLVARKRDVPAFLKARSGEAFVALAKIDKAEALAHAKRLAALCEVPPAEGGAHEGQ